MTLAAIDWLSISINLLLVTFVVICLLMTLLILMQRPKQEGLGAAFGGGVTDQVFGARTTNVLQRGTVWLGSLFFIISLALAVLIGHQNKDISLAKKEAKAAAALEEGTKDAPEDAVEDKPKSLIDELPADEPQPTPAPVDENAAEAPVIPEETPAPDAQPAVEPETTPPADPAPADRTAPEGDAAAPAEDAPAEEAAAPEGDSTPPADGASTEDAAGESEAEVDQP
jgi:preprotein translocase subunit SecG